MFSVFISCLAAEEDFLIAALWEAGTQGIVEESGGLRAFFDDSIELSSVSRRLGRDLRDVRREPLDDWVQASRDAFPPVCVGRRFFLVPPWNNDPAPDNRLRLEINPGMACGTGYHPCTQLCLEALERSVHPGDHVLDVGAGSGILSKAAALLGAGLVVGCDIDTDAVRIARQDSGAAVFSGSADALRSHSMDIVVANISAAAVEDLADEFQRVRRPRSTLIVSGFSEAEKPDFPAPAQLLRKDGWICWMFTSSARAD